MIEEKAIVVSSVDGLAEVETQRYTACGGCSAKAGCGSALLATLFGRKRNRLQVLNPVQAKPGDQVVIGFDEQALLKSSVILYLLPLLTLLAGAVAGEFGSQSMDLTDSELLSVVGGLVGGLFGLLWVRRKTQRVQYDNRYRPVILRAANRVYLGQPG